MRSFNRNSFFLLLVVLFGPNVHTQEVIWRSDSITIADPAYGIQRYHQVLRFQDPVMYLVFPVVQPLVDRKIPLTDGEGRNGYWLEGHLGYRFAIYKGKYFSAPLLQRMRWTLDVSLLSMLTRDQSNPILPFNNKVGIGFDFLLSPLERLKKEESGMAWATFQFHHYSNGQAGPFFLDTSIQRNNYKTGSFSTNYLRGLLNIASNEKNLLVTSIGFQKEIDPGGPLGNSAELENNYGDGRVLLQFNWVKKPWLVTRSYVHRGLPDGGMVQKDVRRQLGFRTEFEYIVGDLSAFAMENKYRLGWHTYFTYMPAVNNEVGFVLHTYLGRNYLNIRFDDIVFVGGLGFYVKFEGK